MGESFLEAASAAQFSGLERRMAYNKIYERIMRHGKVSTVARNIVSVFNVAQLDEPPRTRWAPFVKDEQDLQKARLAWRRLEAEPDGLRDYSRIYLRETLERPLQADAAIAASRLTTCFGGEALFEEGAQHVSESHDGVSERYHGIISYPVEGLRLLQLSTILEGMRSYFVEAESGSWRPSS